MNKGKAATWDDILNAYQKRTGQHANLLPTYVIYDWAVAQTDLFDILPDVHGTLVYKEKE